MKWLHLLRIANSAKSWFRALFIATVASIGLSACTGAVNTPETATNVALAPILSELGITFTDADGDFLDYTVDVTSITLTKKDGTVVETTPTSSRVNFSDYTDLSEFFSVLTLPVGTYNSITLNLDYTNADIVVQDSSGTSYPAQAVDSAGNVLTQFALSVDLGDRGAVRITAGKMAFLALDFNLDASNTILGFDPAQVAVEPFIVAQADLVDNRDHRARGLLDSVDVGAASITIDIRPFDLRHGDFGKITAQANTDTRYEINGETFSGDAGLAQLATLASGEPIIIKGRIFTSKRVFVAGEVYAGSSVPWSDKDVVRGVVIARNGNQLTIAGAHAHIKDGPVTYRDTITVLLADTTHVTRQLGSDTALTKDDISVGTRMVAVGNFQTADALVLDTSAGAVRIRINQVKGQVVQASPLIVNLTRINGRPVAVFNFAGSGIDPAHDVDPANFEVNTAPLQGATLSAGNWTRIRGFFGAFGSAPDDYYARTLVDMALDSHAAHLRVYWAGGSAQAFSNLSGSQIDVMTSTAVAQVKIAGTPPINVSSDSGISIIPMPSGKGIFALKHQNQNAVTVYHDFAEYTTALQQELDNGSVVIGTEAIGRFKQDTSQFTSVAMTVLLD